MAALSAQLYARVLPPRHFLVQLATLLDWGPLERACAPYQHTAGPGNHATHTVPRLVRALLVKYLRNLSLRELEGEIQTNLLVKWFVGYSLFESGPDHSTLGPALYAGMSSLEIPCKSRVLPTNSVSRRNVRE